MRGRGAGCGGFPWQHGTSSESDGVAPSRRRRLGTGMPACRQPAFPSARRGQVGGVVFPSLSAWRPVRKRRARCRALPWRCTTRRCAWTLKPAGGHRAVLLLHRYYVGHKGGRCGHEFLEFEFKPDGASPRPFCCSGPSRADAPSAVGPSGAHGPLLPLPRPGRPGLPRAERPPLGSSRVGARGQPSLCTLPLAQSHNSSRRALPLRVPAGKLRYANNSQYKDDTMIRKEVPCRPPPAAHPAG